MRLTFKEKETILEAIYCLVQHEIREYDFDNSSAEVTNHIFRQYLERLDELDKLRNKFEKEMVG